MKKALLIGFAAVAAMLLVAAPSAFALTAAHTATHTKASQGDCSGCHLPHKAKGAERLFPIAPGAGAIASLGFIGAFCAEYCHAAAALPNADATGTALYNVGGGATGIARGSHGIGRVPGNRPQHTVIPATLPYGDGTNGTDALGSTGFECTTCHNPHKNATGDTSEALLQLDIDALCDECHTARGQGNTTWASGYGDANALGSHPVGTDVNDDIVGNGGSGIFVGIGNAPGASAFDAAYGASAAHNLGGHLINGGAKDGATGAATNGVTCATCHAVHGLQPDGGATTNPFEDLIVIQQGTQGTAEPAFRANGNGDDSNALCFACHSWNSTAAGAWNPGATSQSHPVYPQAGSADRGISAVTDFSAAAQAWPFGSATNGVGLSVGVLCESCHAPHPTDSNVAPLYGAVAGTHILRADEQALCDLCHTGSFADHHPAGIAMTARYVDAAIDTGVVGVLECADCHQGNGAHNWLVPAGVGLNPAWEPADNGRATDGSGARFQANTSKECIDCHTNAGAHPSPTQLGDDGALTDRGEGSHYIGASSSSIANGNLANGTLGTGGTTAFNAFTGLYPGGGWPRFGGTAAADYVMVCESCHELEPDKNHRPSGVGSSHALLLYAQVEDEVFPVSNLCTSCHGIQPGGVRVHPLTGDTISAAVDAGRGTTTLLTTGATYANQTGAPLLAEYPADDQMNCDSCHQVHKAPTQSGTYILEYNTGSGTGLAAVSVYGVNIANFRALEGQGIDHLPLCLQCHNY